MHSENHLYNGKFQFNPPQNPLNIYQYIMCVAQLFFIIIGLPKELRGSKYCYNVQFKDNVVGI